jgi:hypothetical protein
VFEKVPPNVDEANVEAGDQLIFRQQALGDGLFRVKIHSTSGGIERFAYRPRGAGGIVGGAMTFAIDYGQVTTPVVATRALGTIVLTDAARCIPITLLGALRVTRAAGGICP